MAKKQFDFNVTLHSGDAERPRKLAQGNGQMRLPTKGEGSAFSNRPE